MNRIQHYFRPTLGGAPAYSWLCPCGAKNWEEAEVFNFVAPFAGSRKPGPAAVCPPLVVRCRECGEAFAAQEV